MTWNSKFFRRRLVVGPFSGCSCQERTTNVGSSGHRVSDKANTECPSREQFVCAVFFVQQYNEIVGKPGAGPSTTTEGPLGMTENPPGTTETPSRTTVI